MSGEKQRLKHGCIAHLGSALEGIELRPWRAFLALALDWSLIVGCFMGAARFPSVPAYIAAAVLIARTQLALAVLMHEAAHGLLSPRRRVNDFVGQAFAAGPLVLSLFVYRAGHLKHHRAPMAIDDPVAVVFGIGDYPISRSRLVARLLADLTGVGYVTGLAKLLTGHHRHALKAAPGAARRTGLVALSILATNGLLFAALAAAGHSWLYLGLWLLPALTVLQVVARLRAIMEHAGYSASEDQRQNARTIVRPSWQTFFCGPHAVHYHIEHHTHVRVPFYRLRDVHQAMAAAGQLPAENLYGGYGRILAEVTTTNVRAA